MIKRHTLSSINFKTEFYWNGERYKQFIKPKAQRPDGVGVCYKVGRDGFHYENIPLRTIVKPVVRISNV